jgi:DNA polymerase delta subunit 1
MTIEQAVAFMQKITAEINADLFASRPPQRLAPEKVLGNTVFEGPKRYCALKYEDYPKKKPELFFRGIETVRRDWVPLVNRAMKRTCDEIMVHNNPDEAERYVTSIVADLYAGRIELQELILSKGLTQEPENYTNRQTHAELVKRMRERDPGTAPRVGDRVVYVMVDDVDSQKRTDWSEDPLYLLEHSLPLNIQYYAEHLQKPLERLLTPVIGEQRVHRIFNGQHTRVRHVVMPTLSRANTLTSFVVKLGVPCALCRATVPTSEKSVYCRVCRSDAVKQAALRQRKQQELADAETQLAQAEATCRRCQDLQPDEPIVCGARDCDQLYKRHFRLRLATKARAEIDKW